MVKSISKIIVPIILIMVGVGGSAYSYIYWQRKTDSAQTQTQSQYDINKRGNLNDPDQFGGRSRRKGLKRRNKSKKI